LEINPFDYKDICYDDYLKALYDEDEKSETIIKIGKIEKYKKENDLPKINNTTCKNSDINNTEEKQVESEKHIYATGKSGISTYHIIKKGETLDSIAKSYNVTVLSIMKLNNIRDKRNIKSGKTIKVL